MSLQSKQDQDYGAFCSAIQQFGMAWLVVCQRTVHWPFIEIIVHVVRGLFIVARCIAFLYDKAALQYDSIKICYL